MQLQKVDLLTSKVDFYFLESNRSVEPRKELKADIQQKGVITAISVVAVSDLDPKIPLRNRKGEVVNRATITEGYAILDGQHRYTILSDLVQAKKDNKRGAELHSTILPYTVYTADEVGDANAFVISLNSTARNWKGEDYIANASKVRSDDYLIRVVSMFEEKKFSVSTISRYVCFNKVRLTATTLAAYLNSNGATEIEGANPNMAVRLYRFLQAVGFSESFLRKRYLIDYIISETKRERNHRPVLARLSVLKHVKEINELKDKEKNISEELKRIVDEDFKAYRKEHKLSQAELTKMEGADYLSDFPDTVETADFDTTEAPETTSLGDAETATVSISDSTSDPTKEAA